MIKPLWIPWRWWRRIVQLGLLVLFFWLFRRTELDAKAPLTGWEGIFFRMDPLVGAVAMTAGRCFIALFWPALILLVFTVFLGRFFCGWICPLGTMLDYFHTITRPLSRRIHGVVRTSLPAKVRKPVRFARYAILAACLVGAAMSFSLIGFVDPFALLTRGLAFAGDPAWYRAVDGTFNAANWKWGTDVLQPFFQKHLLPFRENQFFLAGASAAILGAIFALELVGRRLWCRDLCPLGALIGLVGHFPFVRRTPGKTCRDCNRCAHVCPMNAHGPNHTGEVSSVNCHLCMTCVDECPKAIVKFGFKRTRASAAGVDISRRGLIAAALAGGAIPALSQTLGGGEGKVSSQLLRPPGAQEEKKFLALCVRCGLCMKVCPTNVLQPAVLESGMEGMFSPRLSPRLVFEQTYCEQNCTLCGQVCPSGAIRHLLPEVKRKTVIGKAYFDHKLCLPWAKGVACIRCEEMCPLEEKAIKIQKEYDALDENGLNVLIQQPRVDRNLCVGCGICESNCPINTQNNQIQGPAGIRVFRADAADPGTEFLTDNPPTLNAAPSSQPAASSRPASQKSEKARSKPANDPYGQ